MSVKSLEIEPIKYKGSVSEFRGWMDLYLSKGGGNVSIPLPRDVQLEIMKRTAPNIHQQGDIVMLPSLVMNINHSPQDKDTNREVWYVYFYDPRISVSRLDPVSKENFFSIHQWATILAVEHPPNYTTVEFLDGILFRRVRDNGIVENLARGRPIGEHFSSYMKFVKEKWEESRKGGVDLQSKPAKHKAHSEKLSNLKPEKSSKRGRKTRTDDEKLLALRAWDKLDKSFSTLREFLDQRFGTGEGYVAESTFHSWRQALRDKGVDI